MLAGLAGKHRITNMPRVNKMQYKVSELEGEKLNEAVALAKGWHELNPCIAICRCVAASVFWRIH